MTPTMRPSSCEPAPRPFSAPSMALALARNEADGSEALEESPYTIGRTPDVPRSGSFGMPGAAAPTGLAQPRARKARTTTPTEKKEESK